MYSFAFLVFFWYQRLSARLTATRLELGELKRRGFAEAASTQRKNSNFIDGLVGEDLHDVLGGRDGVDRGLSRRVSGKTILIVG